jgi:uncharacterized membrane protein YhaH (DUF805 family)
MNFGTLLFSFQGRLNRAKYWLAVLIYVVASMIGNVLDYAMGFTILGFIISLVVLVSSIGVGIRRLHDRDKSGWWLLLFYLAPGILVTIGVATGIVSGVAMEDAGMGMLMGGGIALIFIIPALAILIWAFVELGCLRGTVGPNRFGPDPLAEGMAPAAQLR